MKSNSYYNFQINREDSQMCLHFECYNPDEKSKNYKRRNAENVILLVLKKQILAFTFNIGHKIIVLFKGKIDSYCKIGVNNALIVSKVV